MRIFSNVLVGMIIAEHVGFLCLEMFLWRTPVGLRIFGLTQAAADSSAALAANQGLYNGFLAAGLAWGLFAGQDHALTVKTFFLCCIVMAGLFGGFTVSRSIAFVQALPAAAALGLLWSARANLVQ